MGGSHWWRPSEGSWWGRVGFSHFTVSGSATLAQGLPCIRVSVTAECPAYLSPSQREDKKIKRNWSSFQTEWPLSRVLPQIRKYPMSKLFLPLNLKVSFTEDLYPEKKQSGNRSLTQKPSPVYPSQVIEIVTQISNGGVAINFPDTRFIFWMIPVYHREDIIINDATFFWQLSVSIPTISMPRPSIFSLTGSTFMHPKYHDGLLRSPGKTWGMCVGGGGTGKMTGDSWLEAATSNQL